MRERKSNWDRAQVTLDAVLRSDRFWRDLPWALLAIVAAVILGVGAVGIAHAVQPEPLSQRYVTVTPSSKPGATPTPEPPQLAQMAALAAALPPGSVSVAALNLGTGATFTFGSTGGQTTASIVKLDILETLLLQKQAAGLHLDRDEKDLAEDMIEDSDDDAASDLWEEIGGGSAVSAANVQLGVPCTVPGTEDYWGLTTTCAQGQVQLLYQLVDSNSPLQPARRSYILYLMDNVSTSQNWGVPVVADPGSLFAVKNGWLDLDGSTGWAINSDGIVTYHGQTLLISVLTQNDDSMYSGVSLVEQLAALAAQAVTSPN